MTTNGNQKWLFISIENFLSSSPHLNIWPQTTTKNDERQCSMKEEKIKILERDMMANMVAIPKKQQEETCDKLFSTSTTSRIFLVFFPSSLCFFRAHCSSHWVGGWEQRSHISRGRSLNSNPAENGNIINNPPNWKKNFLWHFEEVTLARNWETHSVQQFLYRTQGAHRTFQSHPL